MPIRRPNLLDAFRQARDLPARPAGGAASGPGTVGGKAAPQPAVVPPPVAAPRVVAPAPRVAPAVAWPIGAPPAAPVALPRALPTATPLETPVAASAMPRETAPAIPRAIAPAAALPAAPRRERVVLLGLALAVATLVLVALLRSGDEAREIVSAAQPAAPQASPAPPRPAPDAQPANPARTKYDDELYDPANRSTVRLIQYPNDARGLALATETYRWLIKNGYPVGNPILLANGSGIVLVADAKPTEVELIPLRDFLRGLRYPTDSKTRPFSTAFVDKIDNVLAR